MADEEWGADQALPMDYFDRPSPARMWNYLQGGKDHYPLDRHAGEVMSEAYAEMGYLARQCRELLIRMVRFTAGECGIRQFLDLGCGLPAAQCMVNVHDVAQSIHPDARVVYTDNDPVVIAHAQAMLVPATDTGQCAYFHADARDPATVLSTAARTLDLAEPVAVILFGLLGSVAYREALTIVAEVMDAVAAGSYLLFQDGVDLSERRRESVRRRNATGIGCYQVRTPEQMNRYFTGMQLVEPGLVTVTQWRPESTELDAVRPVESYGALARKT